MIATFKNIYNKMLNAAASKHAEPSLAIVSFACSIFFPIPQDVMLVPMCLAKPKKAFRYASIAIIASVLGGLCAYAIGYFATQAIAIPILKIYGHQNYLNEFSQIYNQHGGWVVFAAASTPIPYKVIAIVSGGAKVILPIFILASIAGRAIRFFGIAIIIYLFGEKAKYFIDKYFSLCCWLLLFAILGGFVALKLL